MYDEITKGLSKTRVWLCLQTSGHESVSSLLSDLSRRAWVSKELKNNQTDWPKAFEDLYMFFTKSPVLRYSPTKRDPGPWPALS